MVSRVRQGILNTPSSPVRENEIERGREKERGKKEGGREREKEGENRAC
jgi:hypothetical protein